MKTKSLFFAALVMVSAVAVAFGKDEPRKGMAIVPVKGSEVFKVIYKGESAGRVKLNIYNADAKLILTETFNSTNGFIVPLNFTGLESGEYSIELIDALGKKVEKISYNLKKNEKFVHVNKINGNEGKYLLSVANTASINEVSVKIYDASNTLVHSETQPVNGDFAKVFKLKDATASYTFEVSDNTGNVQTIRF